MKLVRKLLVCFARSVMGRHPTDAEIIAHARHPGRPEVDLEDIGTGLFLRWGTFCGELEAMPRPEQVTALWRDITVEALSENDFPVDPKTCARAYEAWYVAGMKEAAKEDSMLVLRLFGSQKQKQSERLVN